MSCDGNPLVDVRTGARHADVQLGGLWNRHCLKEDANRRMRRWFEREGRGVSPRVPGVLNFFRAQTGIWRLLSFVSVRTIKGRSIDSPAYAGARARRGGVTQQGVVLNDLQSRLDCQKTVFSHAHSLTKLDFDINVGGLDVRRHQR